jgi:hypothetical protein
LEKKVKTNSSNNDSNNPLLESFSTNENIDSFNNKIEMRRIDLIYKNIK